MSLCTASTATLFSLILLHHSTAQSDCSSQQPSQSTITSEAVFIGDILSRDIQQALFPGISFTCSGNLTKWSIVAKLVGGGSRFPELQIWRNSGGTNYDRVAHSVVDNSAPTNTAFVYEHTPDNPLPFQAGDILGVFTPPVPRLTFKYQQQGGSQNYYIGGPATAYSRINLDSALVLRARNDYPLVSVEATNPECTSGFIKRNTLLVKASILNNNHSDLAFREATQRIIPDIAFHCSGVILSYTMAALKRLETSTRRTFPKLQVWRRVDSTEWVRIQSVGEDAGLTTTENLNVHRYVPAPPLPFQAGDILGVYQPYSSASVLKIYLQGSGVTNYYRGALASPLDSFRTDATGVMVEGRLPLISVEISAEGHTSTMALHRTSDTILSHSSTILPHTSSDTILSHSSTILPHTSSHIIPSYSPTTLPHTSSHIIPSYSPTTLPHTSSHIIPSYSPTTLPHTSTYITPSLLPTTLPQNDGSVTPLVIVSIVVCLMLIAVVAIAVLGVHMWRRKRGRRGGAELDKCGSRMDAVNRTSAEQSMEYNLMYQPQNPQEIICDGHRQMLTLQSNKAYGDPKMEMQTAEKLTDAEHTYECI